MINPLSLYTRDTGHDENNEQFVALVHETPELQPYQPDAVKAPWHWQARLDPGNGFPPYELNFWPHVGRANREKEKSVEGWDNIRALTAEVIEMWKQDIARD